MQQVSHRRGPSASSATPLPRGSSADRRTSKRWQFRHRAAWYLHVRTSVGPLRATVSEGARIARPACCDLPSQRRKYGEAVRRDGGATDVSEAQSVGIASAPTLPTKRPTGAGAAIGSMISAAAARRSGAEFLALVLTARRGLSSAAKAGADGQLNEDPKTRAPVEDIVVGVQTTRRQLRRGAVRAANSKAKSWLEIHRPVRPQDTIGRVCGDGKPAPLLLSERHFLLFPAAALMQLRSIFRTFPCCVGVGKLLQATPKNVFGETLLTTAIARWETAPIPRFDVQRPPLASRPVLEMFALRRRNSAAAESTNSNADIGGGRRVVSRRVADDRLSQDKSCSLLNAKPLTWLWFSGAGRSLRVPRFRYLVTISMVFSALLRTCALLEPANE
jgi:hypothetical protein